MFLSKHRISKALTLCLALLAYPASAQEVAITLDDLPYVMPSRTTPEQGLQIVRDVNAALDKHDITATGFAVGGLINAQTRVVMDTFADAGHTIGNHSWSHPDYDTLTKRAFRREVRRTDRALKGWMQGQKYYRFPFLREGNTETRKQAAEDVLERLGYVNAPVTIDNDEWRFNKDYVEALDAGDKQDAHRIAQAYLAHMKERTGFFQSLAKRAVGRDVSHILLLHMNKINADHLENLLDWYAASGWTFVTLPDALRDPLYAAPDLYAGPQGLSQIERVMGHKAN